MKRNSDMLRWQALADGQVSGWRRRRLEARAERDPGAREILDGFHTLRRLLSDAETPRAVPVPEGLYWSGILAGIERSAPRRHGASRAVWGWRFAFAGAAGLAVFAVLRPDTGPAGAQTPLQLATGHEVEMFDDATSWISFRSEAQGLTVVWVEDFQGGMISK